MKANLYTKYFLFLVIAIQIHAVDSKQFLCNPINEAGFELIHLHQAYRLTNYIKKYRVIVSVIDTGLDLKHSFLKEDIASLDNKLLGWNYVEKNNNFTDNQGHGTHVAGIIKTLFSNPCDNIEHTDKNLIFMPVEYYSPLKSNFDNLTNSIKSFKYAAGNSEENNSIRAKIINYSGGGPESSELERSVLKETVAKNVLIVTAAGNEHNNLDDQTETNKYYPASYRSEEAQLEENVFKNTMIVVTAIAPTKNTSQPLTLIPSANWGNKTVDIAAPGYNITSSLPHNRYGRLTGTSQATAYVSGAAALIASIDPTLSSIEIKDILLRTAQIVPSLKNKVAQGRVLNVEAAVKETLKIKVQKDKLFVVQ